MKVDVVANPHSVTILPKGDDKNPLAMSFTLSFNDALILADQVREAVKLGRNMVQIPGKG
jgi:hypothetical protein